MGKREAVRHDSHISEHVRLAQRGREERLEDRGVVAELVGGRRVELELRADRVGERRGILECEVALDHHVAEAAVVAVAGDAGRVERDGELHISLNGHLLVDRDVALDDGRDLVQPLLQRELGEVGAHSEVGLSLRGIEATLRPVGRRDLIRGIARGGRFLLLILVLGLQLAEELVRRARDPERLPEVRGRPLRLVGIGSRQRHRDRIETPRLLGDVNSENLLFERRALRGGLGNRGFLGLEQEGRAEECDRIHGAGSFGAAPARARLRRRKLRAGARGGAPRPRMSAAPAARYSMIAPPSIAPRTIPLFRKSWGSPARPCSPRRGGRAADPKATFQRPQVRLELLVGARAEDRAHHTRLPQQPMERHVPRRGADIPGNRFHLVGDRERAAGQHAERFCDILARTGPRARGDGPRVEILLRVLPGEDAPASGDQGTTPSPSSIAIGTSSRSTVR